MANESLSNIYMNASYSVIITKHKLHIYMLLVSGFYFLIKTNAIVHHFSNLFSHNNKEKCSEVILGWSEV